MSNANQENRPANRMRAGGLWLKSNNFGEFYSGKLNLKELVEKFGASTEVVSIVIYPAREQKTPNSPTHNIFADLPQTPPVKPTPTPVPAKTKPAAPISGNKPKPNADFGPESEFGDPTF